MNRMIIGYRRMDLPISHSKTRWRRNAVYRNNWWRVRRSLDLLFTPTSIPPFASSFKSKWCLNWSLYCSCDSNHQRRVLFIGGNSVEHITAMMTANVSIAYSTAKDLCKIRSHGILLSNSMKTVAELLEVFHSTCSMKCTIMWLLEKFLLIAIVDSILCFNQTIVIILIYDKSRYGGNPSLQYEKQL